MKPETKRARLDPAVAAATAVCQLFRLPRELLELVAAYFSRREAALVLTVNSTFHEIFAERVWRRFVISLASSRKTIPLKSVLKYGHLVRRIRVTASIPQSIDLAATFPNITHLWISFYQLANIIKSSQGKCFERLCYLSTWAWDADYDEFETSDDIAPVLNWLDSRFEAESGLQKVGWEVYVGHDMQLPYQIADWLQSTGQFSRIYFKFDNEVLNFGDPQSVDFNKAIPHCLVDWKVEENDGVCATYRFSGILDTIPRAERQHFTFPALKRLRIGTCCNAGDEVYSEFNFGNLFPSVCDLTLDTDLNDCQEHSEDTFGAILAHPWPSVRKLEIYGDSTFKNIMSHLAVVSNVEELTIDRESVGEYDDPDIGVINLCELDRALPKLVRLRIIGDGLISAPIKQQQQQQPLFRHLRYVSFKFLTMTSSAISALVHAPVLTDICLKCVNIVNDDDVDVSDDLDLEIYHEMSSALSHDFLVGVTNPSVQSVDVYVNRSALPVNYEDIIRAMLKCFVRLKVCIIRSYDGKALPGFLSEFPTVKFKEID
ncbi:hypothetical protein GQ42DRAFT_161790 [Ramicandelaber brevisporus]|nr:hypothetical protein GQ42DRAFT_161790 [Ramicandelaber brevisporus]